MIVVTLGTGPSFEREGRDRSNIALPGKQLQLIQDVVDNGMPTLHIGYYMSVVSSIPSVGHLYYYVYVYCFPTANKAPVIVLLFNAGPLDISWLMDSPGIVTILQCTFPGESTGEALKSVFTSQGGDSAPAGRLPVTWPASMAQVS